MPVDLDCRPVDQRRERRHDQRGRDADALGAEHEHGHGQLRHRQWHRHAGTDYTTHQGTATFAAGQHDQRRSPSRRGDTTVEPNETFLVNLTAPVNATIADAQGVVTIINDDAAALPDNLDCRPGVTEGNTGTTSAVVHR